MNKKLSILLILIISGSFVYYYLNSSKATIKNELLKSENVNMNAKKEKQQITNSKVSISDTSSKKEKKLIKNNKKEELNNKKSKALKTTNTEKNVLKHDDYLEIFQAFEGSAKTIVSEEYALDLKNYSFLSLSAYIMPKKSNVTLFYKFYNGKKWSNWQLLPEDKEVHNEKRTVFGLINIQDNIEVIQFKSNTQIEKVVFNIFTPKK